MGLIFFLSAQPDLNSGLGTWDTVGRKLAHMAEYGLLWFLWWRALGYRHPAPSIAITLLYAVSDEVHQSFVEGRHGSPWDVAIDAAGVGVAGLLVVAWARRRRDAYSQPRSVA
jgi:VanZ family protein